MLSVGGGFATWLVRLSKILWTSVVALAVAGAADNGQRRTCARRGSSLTPDSVRGRGSAVESTCSSARQTRLGGDAGHRRFDRRRRPAVVIGGLGTIVVAALWAWGFHERFA